LKLVNPVFFVKEVEYPPGNIELLLNTVDIIYNVLHGTDILIHVTKLRMAA